MLMERGNMTSTAAVLQSVLKATTQPTSQSSQEKGILHKLTLGIAGTFTELQSMLCYPKGSLHPRNSYTYCSPSNIEYTAISEIAHGSHATVYQASSPTGRCALKMSILPNFIHLQKREAKFIRLCN